MATTTVTTADEEQIRHMIDSWMDALIAKDVDRLLSSYSPNILLYDVMSPLAHRGLGVYRKVWEQCFAMFQGPLGYEIHDLSITAGDLVAFSTRLNRISGTRTDGEQFDAWLRVTVCYVKNDGKWLVTHEHVSMPLSAACGDTATTEPD